MFQLLIDSHFSRYPITLPLVNITNAVDIFWKVAVFDRLEMNSMNLIFPDYLLFLIVSNHNFRLI